MRESVEDRYRAALLNPPPKGHRHPQLAGVVALGVMAGAIDAEIVNDVSAAWGYSTGERTEIEDTIRRQRKKFVPKSDLLGQQPAARRMVQPPQRWTGGFTGQQARTFIEKMLQVGKSTTSFEDMKRLSPTPIPPDGLGQTLTFLKTIHRSTDFVFMGDPTEARLRTRVQTVESWIDAITRPRSYGVVIQAPALVGVNALTGTAYVSQVGAGSYRCDETVASGRYARIEYDGMPVPQQLQFWGGVIRSGALPLRALTFSGGKSVHAVLEIGATDRNSWDEKTTKLETLLCNEGLPDDLKADNSFRHPSHMTRTPGARRRENGSEQSLLWLSGEALRPTPATPPPRPPTPPPDAPMASASVMAQKEQPPALERKETALQSKQAHPFHDLVQYRNGRWRALDQTDAEADRLLDAANELNP